MAGPVRVDHAVSSGTFSLDGETFDVDNNIWVVGDDDECVVIDAPHSVDDIMAVVGDRRVKAIICTHAHDDHVRVAPALREKVVAPILLHPDDRPPPARGARGGPPPRRPPPARPGGDPPPGGPHDPDAVLWDLDLADGVEIPVAGTVLRVLHTPGHAPGAVCLHAPDLGCVFTGDTLFHGGPGATGRSYSDRPTLEGSIRAALFALPEETVVHTGHGEDTTIGAEVAALGR